MSATRADESASAPLRPVWEWDEAYIAGLPAAEFDFLEWKASDWLTDNESCMNDLSRYISAFANYDGGYLIIGVPDPERTGKVQSDAGVDPHFKNGVKSWLEDKLPALVSDRVSKINVAEIHPCGGECGISSGRVVVAIHVPPSEGAPHQARDGKYYNRIGSKLVAIRHRELMDVLGRRKNPSIAVTIRLTEVAVFRWALGIRVLNTSRVLARHVCVVVDLPCYLDRALITAPTDTLMLLDAGVQVARFRRTNSDEVLFPEGDLGWNQKIETSSIAMAPASWREIPTIHDIRYRAYADEMPMIRGSLAPSEVVTRL